MDWDWDDTMNAVGAALCVAALWLYCYQEQLMPGILQFFRLGQ